MSKYAILKQPSTPAPTSIFDFIGAALPLLMPVGMGFLGVTGAPAMGMQAAAFTPAAAELGHAAPAPVRPCQAPPRSRLARRPWQAPTPRPC